MSMISPLIAPKFLSGSVPNIVPFTVRENPSQEYLIETMRDWLTNQLVPFVNENLNEFGQEFVDEVNRLNELWQTKSDELIAQVQAVADGIGDSVEQAQAAQVAAEAAAELAEMYANQAVGQQDAAVASLFSNAASQTRAVADALYANLDDVTEIQSVIAGRLSAETLDERFNGKANSDVYTSLETLTDDVEAIEGAMPLKADKSTQETVETGRLSVASLSAEFTDIRNDSVINRLGGFAGDPKFLGLRTAMLSPATTDYRVCVLGSSSSNGAYTTEPEKAVFQRLAYRSGAPSYLTLATVGAPVGGTGLRWWTGAEGNTTSANYFPQARKNALANVAPDMVIHMIGENDYYYGTTINDYIANLEAACDYIESVSPGVINVLVNSHGRYDVNNPVAPWSAYGEAMRQVASNNPAQRYYIDTMEYFAVLGTMNDNRAGMIMGGTDMVHPNDYGHKYLAKIIGAHLGIPNEDDFAGIVTWKFPLPTGVSNYTGAGSPIAELYLPAVNYPRELTVKGALWNTSTNANSYFQINLRNTDTTSIIESHGIKAPVAANSVPLDSTFYCPPRIKPLVQLTAWPDTGQITVQPGALSRAKLIVTPV